MTSTLGQLLVICGIDGAGKTTLQSCLNEIYLSKGFEVLLTRQPTNFYRSFPAVRDYLDTGSASIPIEAIALLSAFDRLLHINQVIKPALDNNMVVICDRFLYSSYAYFTQRGVDARFIYEINRFVDVPHRGIFIKIDPQTAINRIVLRDGSARKFEEKDRDYLEAVQIKLENVIPEGFLKVNGSDSFDVIKEQVKAYLFGNI